MKLVMTEIEFARYCASCDIMHPCIAIMHVMSTHDVEIVVMNYTKDCNIPVAEVVVE